MTLRVSRRHQPVKLFVWDADAQLLRYDGSEDPDPDWNWVAEKHGYEPVNSDHKVWDPRIGMWIYLVAAD